MPTANELNQALLHILFLDIVLVLKTFHCESQGVCIKPGNSDKKVAGQHVQLCILQLIGDGYAYFNLTTVLMKLLHKFFAPKMSGILILIAFFTFR